MHNTRTTGSRAGVGDLIAAISALGIPPPDQSALAAILRNCQDTFLDHLSACIANTDADGHHRKAVEGLLACLSSETGEALRALGFVPTFNALATIGNKAPSKFLSAIPVARDPRHARHKEAKAFLSQALVLPTASGLNIPQPEKEATTRAETVGLCRHGVGQNPEPLRQSGSTGGTVRNAGMSVVGQCGVGKGIAVPREQPLTKEYVSQHVYGAGFALCFNATDWDGAPGVMVDAAVSTGPRHYDWKGAIHLWLDEREVASVLAVFRKRRPSAEFAAHGAANDKSFSLAFQGSHFYAKVAARDAGVRGVKISPTDATAVSILFLRQLGKAYPDIPLDTVLELAMSCNELGSGVVPTAA